MPFSAFGSVVSTRVLNSVVVAWSCGPVVGMTVPVSSTPSGVGDSGVALATPLVPASADCTLEASEVSAEAFLPVSTTMVNGPL